MPETKKKKSNNTISSKLKNVVKSKKKTVKPKAFEEKSDIQKLYLFTVVVEQAVAKTVLKLLQDLGSSAQFIHNGRGTAPSEIVNMLNAAETKKAVINAFVSEDKLQIVQEELNIFFKVNRKNRGIGFAIPLSSIQGIRMYKYLTQTI